MNSEFGHVTYTEAVEILEKNNDKFDYKVFWGCDLQTEHERYLTEEILRNRYLSQIIRRRSRHFI